MNARCLFLVVGWLVSQTPVRAAEPGLRVHPERTTLQGRGAQQQFLVLEKSDRGWIDVTGTASLSVAQPEVATVDADALVTARTSGTTRLVASRNGLVAAAEIVTRDAEREPPVSFELDVLPVLAANGCSVGACHGKARGQNGFQLSLLGFDAEFDFSSLTQHARGRRVFPAAPERSLLLRKAIADLPHGGGRRLEPDGGGYATIVRWIAAGVPRRVEAEPTLTRVELFPTERSMQPAEQQRLIVTAFYSDGSSRDVTRNTSFQSNEAPLVGVDKLGRITAGPLPGEATIMARYMGQIATCNVVIPLAGSVPAETYAALPRNNFIDGLVWQKLATLGLTPSAPCDDAKFLRRVSLDLIGRLPTPDEARAFLDAPAGDPAARRLSLVGRLLERPEYADHWANKWTDLLRPNPYRVGIKAVFSFDTWIRDRFRENAPYDRFVRDLLTAQGSTWDNGAVVLFRDRREPDELTTIVSQLFLGTRLECAKCHHHPFEKWGQDDFYSFAAYFSRIGRKGQGLSPPISGGEEIFFPGKGRAVQHPLTGRELSPRPLFGTTPDAGDRDPREVLADWITADNPFFARTIVNRVWADLMGRGLVEPVDDLRVTNPPTNAPLLDALAAEFVRQKYDLKQLLTTIVTSHVYGLDSRPSDRNTSDTRNYSRHYRQRLRAEVLLDAIGDVTGVRDSFSAAPPGSRSNQLWTVRTDSLFLDTFGRPDPNQDPPCERRPETTVTQALHLMNAPAIQSKIVSDTGRAARLAASDKSPDAIADELYLAAYARHPTPDELAVARRLFAEPNVSRRQATEDLMWALFNTPEFVFKD